MNGSLVFTNVVTGTPVGSYRYYLGPGAPSGAGVNPTNGVFRWTPNCNQASRTNTITIWVMDTGNTNLMDAISFTIEVGECIVPEIGRLILTDGQEGRVPVNLISTVPLTNISMRVEAPMDRLTNLWLETLLPEICHDSITALEDPFYLLDFSTCPGQFLTGTQQIAWLHFTGVTNQHSAFVNLTLDNTVGFQSDGTEVRNFGAQSGRLVIIGEEPLLEALHSETQGVGLILYGNEGTPNVIQSATSLDVPINWQPDFGITLTNLFQVFEIPTPADNSRFYRAERVASAP